MDIEYRTKKLQRICTSATDARKEYGLDIAEKLQQRINELKAADSLEFLSTYHIGNCHRLSGDRTGQYAMSLTHPYRLILEKNNNSVNIVKIVEIVDYH